MTITYDKTVPKREKIVCKSSSFIDKDEPVKTIIEILKPKIHIIIAINSMREV